MILFIANRGPQKMTRREEQVGGQRRVGDGNQHMLGVSYWSLRRVSVNDTSLKVVQIGKVVITRDPVLEYIAK